MHRRSQITGTGSFLPPRVVRNQELESQLNTTNSWIQEKIGIRERRFVDPGVGASDLALVAANKALISAEKTAHDLDCILFATSTPDYHAPGCGVLLQNKLGCHKIPAYDLRNTSPGFLFALEMGDQFIRSGKYHCILVVASEVHSTGLDFSERGRLMTVIFGDGAGAVILEPTEGDHGIVSTRLHSDGSLFDKLWCEAPSSLQNPRISQDMIDRGAIYPTMDGRLIFKASVKLMGLVSKEILVAHDLTANDIAHVVPHQANLRIIEALAEELGIPMDRVFHNIEYVGNTNAASIPIALDELNDCGKIKKNDLILTMSFGSGLSWGAGLIRW